jgi:hypothetical protein
MISYISELCGITFMVQEQDTEILLLLKNLQIANLVVMMVEVYAFIRNDIWIALTDDSVLFILVQERRMCWDGKCDTR